MATQATMTRGTPAMPKSQGMTVTHVEITGAAILLVVHIALAFMIRPVPQLATAHAVVAGVGACIYAMTTKNVRRIGAVAAYLVGCEVLWRMSKATVFWEYGKYASAAVFAIGLLRLQTKSNRALVLMYFGLLLPSILITITTMSAEEARQQISFNLSGPLAMTLAVLFFSNSRQTRSQQLAAFWAFICPAVGIGALALASTITRTDIEFVNASTAATSGGYAANQVSAVLGFGVLLLLLLATDRRYAWAMRVPLICLAVPLGAQTVMTFARGGIVLALAGMASAMFILMRGSKRARIGVILVAIVVTGVGRFVIEPRLEEMTRGELSVRYSERSSTGRDRLIDSELELFKQNVALGAGPGGAARYRREHDLFEGASHTEYTRMLAEHGILGLLSIICFIALCIRAVRSAQSTEARAVSVALVVWAALFLSVYGTRIAAPSFAFGLAFARAPRPRAPPALAMKQATS
jgi:O-antigen ligase